MTIKPFTTNKEMFNSHCEFIVVTVGSVLSCIGQKKSLRCQLGGSEREIYGEIGDGLIMLRMKNDVSLRIFCVKIEAIVRSRA